MSDIEGVLAIWQRASEAHADLWASHLLVALASFGLACTRSYRGLARGWRAAAAFLFLNIAIANGWSIWDNLALYNAAIEVLQGASAGGSQWTAAAAALHRIDAGHLLGLHALVDAGVLLALVWKPGSARASD